MAKFQLLCGIKGSAESLLTMVLKTKGAAHQVRENQGECPNLVRFPQGELPAPNLKPLIIIECDNLKSLPERIHTLTALRELRIDGLPNLVSFAERGLPPNLRHFSIQNCEGLRVLVREHWGLQQLVSLEEFYIGGRASDDILEMLLKEQLLLPLFTL